MEPRGVGIEGGSWAQVRQGKVVMENDYNCIQTSILKSEKKSRLTIVILQQLIQISSVDRWRM